MTQSTEHVIFERQGPLAILTFNRPEARNAMTFAMYEALHATCERIDADDEIRVLILRGAGGRAFVAGTDISQFLEFKTEQDALAYEQRMNRVIGRLEAVDKAVIAMITGYATGGGASIAMASDLRLCTPESKFGVPIARTLGNCLSMANYNRLVGLIGPARAKELIFTARLLSADEALAAGFVNEIVPADRIEARTLELATEIAGNAPLTIKATKEAIRRIQAHHRPPGGEDIVLSCYMSEDFREGVRAFLEKRKPVWKGK